LLAVGCTGNIDDGNHGRPTPPGAGGGMVATDAPRTCGARIGPSPLHRLTRLEYDNTVRDLLGEDLGLARDFTEDERAGTFTGNSFTPISEMQFSQYATAAGAAADRAAALATKIVPCDPASDAAGCAARFIRQFGRKAFRRPLDDAEVARYQSLFDTGRAGADFSNGVRLLVQAMLQSPHFVYLVEGPGPLTQHQMAARLSYFLWNAPPDAALATAADGGQLATLAGLRAQARRLLADPRALAMVTDFHTQWLGLERLPKLQKDQTLYREFDGLRGAIGEETGRFVAEVMSSDGGRLESLLAAPYTVVNGPLGALYGVPVTGADWRKVPLDPRQRAGLLTQAGFLAAHGALDGSSPIRRGLAVRERLLCAEVPVPPPGADQNVPPLTPSTTTRQRFDKHRSVPSCAACHALMDKLGYGFESYDGIGRFRTTENGVTVDDSGELIGTDIDGPFRGAPDLAHRLAQSPRVAECVATQWFRYAFGRLETDLDRCVVDELLKRFKGADLRVADLLLAVVESDAFRTYRAVE
jgi:hypothetical protein